LALFGLNTRQKPANCPVSAHPCSTARKRIRS